MRMGNRVSACFAKTNVNLTIENWWWFTCFLHNNLVGNLIKSWLSGENRKKITEILISSLVPASCRLVIFNHFRWSISYMELTSKLYWNKSTKNFTSQKSSPGLITKSEARWNQLSLSQWQVRKKCIDKYFDKESKKSGSRAYWWGGGKYDQSVT